MHTGLYVPVVTPFDADGAVDGAGLAAVCDWVVEQGAAGVMLFGTTGEGQSMTVAEKLAAAGALTAARPQLPVVLAATEASLAASLDLVTGCAGLALDAVLVLPPFFFRDAPVDLLTACFERVLEVARHPVLAYHLPERAPGVPHDVLRLDGLFGVKDSSGDIAFTYAAIEAGRTVYVGAEALLPQAVAAGAAGAIAGMGNLVPGTLARLVAAAAAGDVAGAERLRDEVIALQRAVLAAAPGLEFIAAFKQVLSQVLGVPLGVPRLPLPARRDYLVLPELVAAVGTAGVTGLAAVD